MIYLYLNNYALINERKNMPSCILIRYMFNRTLLFIVSINLYYRCDDHIKINYKSTKHKICTIHVIVFASMFSLFFSYCNVWAYLLVKYERVNCFLPYALYFGSVWPLLLPCLSTCFFSCSCINCHLSLILTKKVGIIMKSKSSNKCEK